MFYAETHVLVRPGKPRRVGEYELVAQTATGPLEETYWAGGDRVIHVEPRRARTPFAAFFLDFDGTLVDTEGPGRFFWERRSKLMQEVGVEGDDDECNRFQELVWRWEGNTERSYDEMIERIRTGVDRRGIRLDTQTQTLLWPLTQFSGRELADRAEAIGVEMLAADPKEVLHLAPMNRGVAEFIDAISPAIPLGIISGSRRLTTIGPILEAHAAVGNPQLRQRVGNLVVGEEDVPGSSKPEPAYYTAAFIAMARIMQSAGKIPRGGVRVADIAFVADRVGDLGLDIASRRQHSVISVGVGDIEPPGPLAAVVADFPTLLAIVRQPLHEIFSPVLQRLARTLTASAA